MTALINPDDHHRKNLGDEMLSLQEACRFLRVPEGTLRYWRHLGSGPRSFKVGRHVRYWRTDLIGWLTEQTNRPQAENQDRYPQITELRSRRSNYPDGN